MKSKVIFYCVLIFYSELVASVSYAAELQQYSGTFQNRASVERSLQGNIPRPYQSVNQYSRDDGLYNPPNLQYQELPRINRDSYFAQNPRESYSNLPVREISSIRYPSSQLIQNDFLQAHNDRQNYNLPRNPIKPIQNLPQIQHQNNRFINEIPTSSAVDRFNIRKSPLIGSLLKEDPSLKHYVNNAASKPREPNHLSNAPVLQTLSESFLPQIPSIPVGSKYRNNEHLILSIDDHFLKTANPSYVREEYSAPDGRSRSEYNISPEPIGRFHATAGNPVEHIPEPIQHMQPQSHDLEHLFKAHPKIQNVLSTVRNKKRYLVIHPNGTTESVDNLETVAERHPNYVLIKAGDVTQHEKQPVTPLPVAPISVPPKPAAPTPKPHVIVTHKPVVILKQKQPALAPTEAENAKEKNVDHNANVVQTTTMKNIQKNSTFTSASLPQITFTQPPATKVPKIILSPVVKQQTILNSTESPLVSSTEIVFTPTNATEKSIVSTKKTDTVLQPNSVRKTKNETLENIPAVNSTTSAPTTSTGQPNATTVISVTQVPESSQPSLNTYNQPKANSSVHVPENKIANPSSVTPTSENKNHTDTSTVPPNTNTSVPTSRQTVTITPKAKVSVKVSKNKTATKNHDDKAPVATTTVSPIQNNTLTTSAPNKKNTNNAIPTVPNLGDLDISHVKTQKKPAIWFRTSDPNFWDKLTEGNETFDVVYFFQIQNQPRIERDIKKTIYPNGTIVEELTKTVWENDSDKPKVTKTTNIIKPDDV